MPWSSGNEEKHLALVRLSAPGVVPRVKGVVDLGAGAGLWWDLSRTHGIGKVPWTAIEVHRPYVHRFQLRARYAHVRIRSLTSVRYASYAGCVFIFGDVLEHLERDVALTTLRRAADTGTVVVMMPFLPTTSEKQDDPDVPSEQHRYVWRWDEWLAALDLLGFRPDIVATPPGEGRNKGLVILWHPAHARG